MTQITSIKNECKVKIKNWRVIIYNYRFWPTTDKTQTDEPRPSKSSPFAVCRSMRSSL